MKKFAYISLSIFGTLWIFAFSTCFKDGGIPDIADYSILVIFGLIPLGIAIWQLIEIKKQRQKTEELSLDNKIIQIARNQNGKISTLDLVTELHLSVDDSKKELEDLYLKGIFSVQVSNDGGVYYELNKSL